MTSGPILEPNWNISDAYEDDKSSNSSSSGHPGQISGGEMDGSGGVITTHCVSSAIKPGAKSNRDPLQFVKIQSADLSRKAVEQIRLAEKVKITKEKIKEVEEEWQNNLLNWKSKRRLNRSGNEEEEDSSNQTRKTKTFSEIIKEKAKSGQRIGYNLDQYIGEGEDPLFFHSSTGSPSKEEEMILDGGENVNCSQIQCRLDINDDDNVFMNEEEDEEKQLRKLSSSADNQLTSCELPPQPTLSSSSSFSPSVPKECNQLYMKSDIQKTSELDRRDGMKGSSNNKNYVAKNLSRLPEVDQEEQRKKVWNYLLKDHHSQQEIHSPPVNPPSGPTRRRRTSTLSDEDEENGHNEEELEEEAVRQQMLSFRAKLSAFENLAKSQAAVSSSGSSTSSGSDRGSGFSGQLRRTMSEANQTVNNGNQNLRKSRPPAVEDLIRREVRGHRQYITNAQLYQQSLYQELEPEVVGKNDPIYSNREQIELFKKEQEAVRGQGMRVNGQVQEMRSVSGGNLGGSAFHGRNARNSGPIGAIKTEGGQIPGVNRPIRPPISSSQHYPQHGPPPYYQKWDQKGAKNGTRYNMNHWLIQEAEFRRQQTQLNSGTEASILMSKQVNKINHSNGLIKQVGESLLGEEQEEEGVKYQQASQPGPHLYENSPGVMFGSGGGGGDGGLNGGNGLISKPKQQKQMLSVSGRKKCSSCGDELGRGCAAMVIESLSLYYHINCFRCSVCHIQLGNGTCGTDVRVRNHKLHCKNCYSNDEAGLKFSRV